MIKAEFAFEVLQFDREHVSNSSAYMEFAITIMLIIGGGAAVVYAFRCASKKRLLDEVLNKLATSHATPAVLVMNASVRLEIPTAGWRHIRSDPADHIESFKRERQFLNINVRKYGRSDGKTLTEDMVRDAVVTLCNENQYEVFNANGKWIGHFKGGESNIEVDNWYVATASLQDELMVATVIVMFTDQSTRNEIRAALSDARLTRL